MAFQLSSCFYWGQYGFTAPWQTGAQPHPLFRGTH